MSYIQTNSVVILPSMTAAGITLSAADSGKLISIPAATAAGALTLPPLQAGLRYVCRLSATAGFIITVTSQTANRIFGQLNNTDTGAANVAKNLAANAANNFKLAATAVAGDGFDIWSDGTNWYVSGGSNIAGGFTA